tara:strand:- start:349 stop:1848 length:1500 start_codon:yes stop_codon:yes gene_type:complete
MTAIITEKFRLHNASQFVESFSESASSTYYLFIGKSMPYTAGTTGGTDTSPPVPADAVSNEFYSWDSMLAAKKISSTDVSNALPRHNWVNNTVYDRYDDTISSSNTTATGASSLYQGKFYFITTNQDVYKVLNNNSGGAFVGAEPTNTGTTPFASGGYILKYMYTITASEATKFLTSDYMPVSTDTTVSAAAVDGKIESLAITGGSGYTDGTYYSPIYGDGTNQGTSSGAIVRITVSGGAIQDFGLTAGTDTTIQTGGTGYTYGNVVLTDANIFTDAALTSSGSLGSGTGGVIRPIISPKGGHGNDAIQELGGHFVITNTTLQQAEGDDITVENDFRNVGLVVDPFEYGTTTIASSNTARMTNVVKFSSATGTFDVDEEITQATTGAIGRVVEWDATRRLLYFSQERFSTYGTATSTQSFKAFSGTNTITGSTSSAVGTPISDVSDTVTLEGGNTITLTNGYANPELQPDSGNIVYIENRKPIQRVSDQTEDIKLIIEF